MAKKRRKRIVCPNCNTQLKEVMNFCSNCGQENHIRRVTVLMILSDFSKTYFTFDSKLINSLKYLITKPSFLTTEYLKGKIESYFRPIRMYIFISFVFFLLQGITESNTKFDNFDELKNENLTVLNDHYENAKKQNTDNGFLKKKMVEIFSNRKDLKAFYTFVMSKLPIFIFFLIPVFGGVLYLFFYNKDSYYVDHLVFAIHVQSFLFVLLILSEVIDFFFNIDSIIPCAFIFLIYGFIASLKFYKLSKVKTFFRLVYSGVLLFLISLTSFFGFFLILVKYYNI
jgi:hypothetical protein